MCSFIIVTPVPIPRWLSGKKKKKKICLPIQEMQQIQV